MAFPKDESVTMKKPTDVFWAVANVARAAEFIETWDSYGGCVGCWIWKDRKEI